MTQSDRAEQTDAVFDALVEILQRMRHNYRDVALALDPEVSPLGLRILGMVRSCDQVTGSQLVQKTDSDPATISRMVKSLIDLGYLVSSEDASDRRVRVLRLTAAGEQLSQKAGAMLRRMMTTGLDSWPADVVASFSEQLREFARDVAERQAREATTPVEPMARWEKAQNPR